MTADGFGFRFVKSGYVVVYLRLFGLDLLNVRPCFSLFGSSVNCINGGHLHNRPKLSAGAQPSQGFNFSFDVAVVFKIADIVVNIHIINIADRVYGQEQFAERGTHNHRMAKRDEDSHIAQVLRKNEV